MILKMKANGKEHLVHAQVIKNVLWVHFNGRIYRQDLAEETKRSRNKNAGAQATNDIAAPMPGKVTKILVKLNEKVTKGQAVIVMEAMKMEYTLKSDMDAKVTKIFCTVGEQVKLGQILLHMD